MRNVSKTVRKHFELSEDELKEVGSSHQPESTVRCVECYVRVSKEDSEVIGEMQVCLDCAAWNGREPKTDADPMFPEERKEAVKQACAICDENVSEVNCWVCERRVCCQCSHIHESVFGREVCYTCGVKRWEYANGYREMGYVPPSVVVG